MRRMLSPLAPLGREASLTRVRDRGMAWKPGTLGASIPEPSRPQRSQRPPTTYPHPHPLEPNSCVGRPEPVWPLCNARPRGGCFRRQVERGVCALLGKG